MVVTVAATVAVVAVAAVAVAAVAAILMRSQGCSFASQILTNFGLQLGVIAALVLDRVVAVVAVVAAAVVVVAVGLPASSCTCSTYAECAAYWYRCTFE